MFLMWQSKGSELFWSKEYDRNSNDIFLHSCREMGDNLISVFVVTKNEKVQHSDSVSEDFLVHKTNVDHPRGQQQQKMGGIDPQVYTVTWGGESISKRSSYEAFFFGQRERQARFFRSRRCRLFPLLCTGHVCSLHPSFLPDDTQQQQQSQAEQGQHGRQKHWQCRWD